MEEKTLRGELDPFIIRIEEYNPHADIEKIRKAFSMSDEFSWAITKTLLNFKADTSTIISSLLYSSFNSKKIPESLIEKEFGKEILDILRGISRIGIIKFENSEAENVRKIIFAMSKDVRIILIKLAERIQTMRDLKGSHNLSKENKKTAEEILNVYAPIAYKLGVYGMKSELEDLAFYFIDNEAFLELKKKISSKKEEREGTVSKAVEKVSLLLKERGINAKVIGRAKHFYSIYKKMKKENLGFEKIMDLIALRVITESVDDCYRILGIIHSAYSPIISEFSDYIANPKSNMYQSIHTKVIFEGKPLEIQIRTLGMHQMAEEGIAAHWRYKDTEKDKLFDKKIAWMKQILDWKNSAAAKEFIDSLKIDLFKDEIITLTPKGDPISLPEGSTPIDFAYHIHTNVGNTTERAKVNGLLVPLDHKLKAGDVVEIITSKNAHPSRNWLKFAKATFARSKIRAYLNIEGIQYEDEPMQRDMDKVMIEGKTKEQQKIVEKEKPNLAKCCLPVLGDKISAVITKDCKVNIHRADCKNLESIEDPKKLKAQWKESKEHNSILVITVTDRIGVLADVLNAIALMNLNVVSINSIVKKENADIIVEVNYNDSKKLDDAIIRIKQVKSVINVRKR